MKTKEELQLITIGVSTYNRKDYLRLCLDSLLAQTYPNCEIIVVDDGSTDGTGEMMAEEYPQIKYIYQQNGGDASAKNHAVREASGQYVVFNDSDDLFLPDCVERLFQALPDDSGTSCSYGTYQTIDSAGKYLPTKRKVTHYPSGNITGELLKHILVNSCGTLFPVKLYLNAGGFDTNLRVVHDYKLFLQLSLNCDFYAVQEPVFLRRRHGNNLSSSSYAKLHIALDVFSDFVSEHPELQKKYARSIRLRFADYHNKLYKLAIREKMNEGAVDHARNAYRYAPRIKSFFRLFHAKWKLLRKNNHQ